MSYCCAAVVPWSRLDGRRRHHRLFLVLPGSEELAHNGVLQGHDTTGLLPPQIRLITHGCSCNKPHVLHVYCAVVNKRFRGSADKMPLLVSLYRHRVYIDMYDLTHIRVVPNEMI